MKLNLELDKAVAKIKADNAKVVCLQLPEGLKPQALDIQRELEGRTNAQVIVWMGNAYGACDIPQLDRMGVDMLIQFGHADWRV